MLAHAANNAHDFDGLRAISLGMLYHVAELEYLQASFDPTDDLRFRVADAQHAVAVAAFRVEDACKEACRPLPGRHAGPVHEFADLCHVPLRAGADRVQGSAAGACLLEQELLRDDLPVREVALRALQRLRVAERQAEAVLIAFAPSRALVRVGAQNGIAPDHPRQVAELIVRVLRHRVGEGADPHELVAGREMRPLPFAIRYEFPAALGQESVVRSCHERRAVLERDVIGRLDHAPVCEHFGLRVAPEPALARRAVDLVPLADVGNGPGGAVCHEDFRVSSHAVHAPVLAPAIGVDGLVKGDVGGIVARDDRAGALDRHGGRERRERIVLARPAVVERLARLGLEAPLDLRKRAALALRLHLE